MAGFQLDPIQSGPGLTQGVQTGIQLGGAFQEGKERKQQGIQNTLDRQGQQLPLLIEGARRASLVKDPQAKLAILNTMRGNFKRAKLSTEVLDQGIAQLQSGDLEGFKQGTDRLLAMAEQLRKGQRGAPATKVFAPVETTGPGGEKGLAFPTRGAQGQASLQPIPLGEGIKLTRETAKEERQGELELATSKERGKLIARQRQDITSEINKNARQTRRELPKIDKLLDALEDVDTGKFAQAKLILGPFIPGVDPTNEQVLSTQINDFVLDLLQKFPGALSDGERDFAARTFANLGFTSKANKLILNHIKATMGAVLEEEKQFKSFRKGGGTAEDFEFDVGNLDEEVVTLFSDSLNKSISEQDITDTLTANPGLTREQLLQQLGVK